MIYGLALVLVLTFLGLMLSYDYYEKKTGVPTFPTMPAVGRKIVELLKDDLGKRPTKPYTILDLGSGSGQLTRRIAKALPEAHVIGIELSYIPWLRSVMRQRLFGPANLEYKCLDFWPYDCREAAAIVTYLPGKIMERVGVKLRQELQPKTLILANTFPLRADWKAEEVLTLYAPFKTTLSIYRQEN